MHLHFRKERPSKVPTVYSISMLISAAHLSGKDKINKLARSNALSGDKWKCKQIFYFSI